MGPLALPLIMAGAGFAGSLVSNIWSAREAAKNREFQERMSSTAHQREVADLRSAGINPILSANRGASSPSGDSPQIHDLGEGAARGMASGLALRQQQAQLELIKAQTEATRDAGFKSRMEGDEIRSNASLRGALLQAQTRAQDAAAMLSGADTATKEKMLPLVLERARAEIMQTVASAQQSKAMTVLLNAQKHGAISKGEFERRFGSKLRWVELYMDMLKSVPLRGAVVLP